MSSVRGPLGGFEQAKAISLASLSPSKILGTAGVARGFRLNTARCALKDLADIHFLNAKKIVLVQDNLNPRQGSPELPVLVFDAYSKVEHVLGAGRPGR
jgi:hypothetical protein